MTALPKSNCCISPEEYLEGELHSPVRHEYVEGIAYAMAGGSDDHNRIARNIAAHLTLLLRGGPCEAFINDLKLKASPHSDIYYYPDVMVVCDPTDRAKYFRERPSVIFEVLSPETERADRREKLLSYRAIPSLTAYILLEQDRMLATAHRRAKTGWDVEVLEGPNAVLQLPSIEAELPFSSIYERTSAAERAGCGQSRDQN